jgi:CheY-like chemotaxis protein
VAGGNAVREQQRARTSAARGRATAIAANILIVDDRPDKLLVFKTILEELDQNIVTLQSGEEALRWLLDNECAVLLST